MIGTALRKAAPDLKDRLLGILFYYHSDLTEFALSVFAVAWGLWLLLPFPTFAAEHALYARMEQIAPEEIWGGVFVLLGVWQLAAWLAGWHRGRRWLSLLGFFAWLDVTLQLAVGEPHGLAVPLAGTIALMSLLAFLHNGGTRE